MHPDARLPDQRNYESCIKRQDCFLTRPIEADPQRVTVDLYRIEVDNRIIKSRSLAVSGDPNFTELAFYTNALNTETQGLDVVAVLTGNDNMDFSLAYNYNDTEVVSQTQVNDVDPVSESTVFNIENNLPNHRATATLTRRFGKLEAMGRANFYGSTIDERGQREEVGSETLVDLELNYRVDHNVTVIAGASNLFNNFPDEIDTRLSQGMPYPRRTPIGYHGGMAHLRLVYTME